MARSKFEELHDSIDATQDAIIQMYLALVETGAMPADLAAGWLESITEALPGRKRVAARGLLETTLDGMDRVSARQSEAP